MCTQEILLLLSQQRQPEQPAKPASVSRTKILSLLRDWLDPNEDVEQLPKQMNQALHGLWIKDEILKAVGNRYCVAPPALLASSATEVNGLQFRGDRAYLTLAHETLKTSQSVAQELLRPKSRNFDSIKMKLQRVGIRLMTIREVIEKLPKPRKPQVFLLQGCKQSITDAELQGWIRQQQLSQYIPSPAEQDGRWRSPKHKLTASEALLKHAPNDYLWLEAGEFYHLDRDTAVLSMFFLDRQHQQPIRIVWQGMEHNRLNLSGIELPYAHAQLLWQLSEAVPDQRRVRIVRPGNRTFVQAIFEHLGCDLIR